ncbi:MAG: hypothetical protein N4J56_003040 [Chroococcidiopsis sp. SAG 2025]|uniref:hypothetical protein n=1 Tax=Chroococcidiopsis sp. SAG 2025 TaxID=171389 RepID=UPI0029372AD2|nr:hypothetical protein [Chroococcidiopsis sp. SAG 2025]MDV2993386.1 hypothetical protein [Chroococcidiopsis sp. SAG 2025]
MDANSVQSHTVEKKVLVKAVRSQSQNGKTQHELNVYRLLLRNLGKPVMFL